ncbi:hypothetical protein U9M48_014510 [Paspalum notatum var. saurae]|uniref:Uncharacterized protein n=1 Tax=Paspalum notatum var. saurae TaxID=547442 RepID=A0AAQ3T387_PASNO
MQFRVSGRGGRQSRRARMAVARLGDAAPRRRGRLLALGRLVRLRALLLRSRRALARLRDYYADMMRRLVADAAAAEPATKAGRMVEAAGTGRETARGRPAAVVPAAVTGAVLRCNSHYHVR